MNKYDQMLNSKTQNENIPTVQTWIINYLMWKWFKLVIGVLMNNRHSKIDKSEDHKMRLKDLIFLDLFISQYISLMRLNHFIFWFDNKLRFLCTIIWCPWNIKLPYFEQKYQEESQMEDMLVCIILYSLIVF